MSDLNDKKLLERIKRNEKKSGIRMVVAITASLILGVLTFYYAVSLNDAKATIEKSLAATEEALADTEEAKAALKDSRDVLTETEESYKNLLRKCSEDNSEHSNEINLIIDKSEKTGYLIYMHDRSLKGRRRSRLIKAQLEEKGYKVAGIERMDTDFESSIRYFHESDKRAAEEVLEMVNDYVDNERLRIIELTPLLDLKSPRKQIEIWLKI